jgi:hypothetical protein
MLPAADGSFGRLDAELLLSIYPDLALVKELASQIDMVLTAAATAYRARGLSSEADMVLAASSAIYRERGLSAESDMVLTAAAIITKELGLSAEINLELTGYMTFGTAGGSGMITRY